VPTKAIPHLSLAGASIVLGACAQHLPATSPRCSDQFFAQLTPHSSTAGRTFKVCLALDTVRLGQPAYLHYFIANGPEAVRLNNQDGFFVKIESDAGDSVRVYSKGSLTHSDGDASVFTLPAWGILGQTVDLTCMQVDPYHSGPCWWGYKLERPGRYRVIASFNISFANLASRAVDTTTLILTR